MPTYTDEYSFIRPTVGGDSEMWGVYLNSNWTTLDALLHGTLPSIYSTYPSKDVPMNISELIASATQYNVKSVTLKQILGRNNTPTTDTSAATLNAVLEILAGEGYAIIDPDNMKVRITEQLQVFSNQQLLFNGRTTFLRDYSASGNDNATFTTGADDDWQSNIKVTGAIFDVYGEVATTDIEGHHWKFYANDSQFYKCKFLNHFKGAAMFARGNRNHFSHLISDTPDLDPGGDTNSAAAGFRLSEGEDTWFTDTFARGPNDQLMLVLGMQDFGTDFIRRSGYKRAFSHSYRAKMATIGASENGSPVDSFAGGIEDCLMEGIYGKSARYGIRTVADGSTKDKTIHRVTWRDIHVDLDQTGNEGIDAMQIKGLDATTAYGTPGGSIGDVTYENVTCNAIGVRTNGVIDAPYCRLAIRGFEINGDRTSFNIKRAATVSMEGNITINGVLVNAVEGVPDASADDRSPVKFDDTFTGECIVNTKIRVTGVSTPTVDGDVKLLNGFNIRGGHLILNAGAEVTKTPASAAGTRFARAVGAGKITVGAPITGDVTNWVMDGNGTLVNKVALSFTTLADAVAFATSTTDHVQIGATIRVGSTVWVYDGVSVSVPTMPGWILATPSIIYGQQDSDYVLTSTTAMQKLFNISAAGAITLAAGRYSFEVMAILTSMAAVSGNATWSLKGAGTAVLDRIAQSSTGQDQGNPQTSAAVAQGGSFGNTETMVGQLAVAGTATGLGTKITGLFSVSTGGTIIPSIALVSAAAAQLKQGSYMRITPLNGTANATAEWS